MSDPSQNGGKPAEPQGGNRQQLDKLIFEQNLDEVHLLVDFVSGRADRSLATLAIPNGGNPVTTMTSRQIIEKIAEMRYPPNGSDAANADNAAILLLAKDRLSALAAAARGLTVAYTAMFIAAESKTWPTRLRDWVLRSVGWKTDSGRDRSAGDATGQDTRIDLAVRAFPMLQTHAQRFRRWRDRLATFALLWLGLTALAYWDAGLGRAALERLDQNWKTYTDELRDSPVLLNCDGRRSNGTNAPGDAKLAEEAARAELACRRHEYHRWMGETAGNEVHSVFRCEGMDLPTRVVHVCCWHCLDRTSSETARYCGTATAADQTAQTHPATLSSRRRRRVPSSPVGGTSTIAGWERQPVTRCTAYSVARAWTSQPGSCMSGAGTG